MGKKLNKNRKTILLRLKNQDINHLIDETKDKIESKLEIAVKIHNYFCSIGPKHVKNCNSSTPN